jgi:hypothetical protein
MNLGRGFLFGVLRILALFYGPPFFLAITAGILARSTRIDLPSWVRAATVRRCCARVPDAKQLK